MTALKTLSDFTGVTVDRLKYYNDLRGASSLQSGQVLYLKPKKNKALTHYHVLAPGETLWSVSQKYGIKLSKLKTKNRLSKRQTQVKPGRVLWLRFIRPADEPVAYQEAAPQESTTTQPVVTRSKTKNPAQTSSARTSQKSNKTSPQETVVTTNQDTVKKQKSVALADVSQKQGPPQVVEADQADTQEQEEFVLDEPVNFVGVDKSANVTNSAQKVHVVKAGETLLCYLQAI